MKSSSTSHSDEEKHPSSQPLSKSSTSSNKMTDAEIDILERDALSARIRMREENQTKRFIGETLSDSHSKRSRITKSDPHSNEELKTFEDPVEVMVAARKGRDERRKQDPFYMNRLRIEARRSYLKKREGEQLKLAERTIEEKEWMYQQVELTKTEKEMLQFEKKHVDLAKKTILDRDTVGHVDTYRMPDSYDEDTEARLAVLTMPYVDHVSAKGVSEQEIWEAHQTAAAKAKFGSQVKTEKPEKVPTYRLIKEDGADIDFVLTEALGGLATIPGKTEEVSEFDLTKEERESQNRSRAEKKRLAIQKERRSLPVFAYRSQLLEAIQTYHVLVVVGETGSGKTTQIPQYLHEVGYTKLGMVACTQPRRVAAMSVASRVASEMGVKLGMEVGYCIRFEDCTCPHTLIKYMTDGMLLREFLTDPELQKYTVILIDEAHERTLHTDVLFGLIKDLTRYRDDLRVIISSATLEAEKFSDFFDNAPIFKIPGRRFPVNIYYTKSPEANFLDASVVTVLQIHLTQPAGDILLFLPGQQEIEEVVEELERRIRGKGSELAELLVLPIYSTLPTELQAKIFEPTPKGARKVVVATNIAETSITIDNIAFVIDPGFCKQNSYNPKTGMESLITIPCSKASANQRAGRAGRVRAGSCFRLYTKFSYEKEMDDDNVPEIQRSNLGHVVLSLKSLGIDDILNFDFMDPPPPDTLMQALELLYALAALNDKGQLTKLGRRMAEFPMDPMYSKMLIQSEKYGCVDEILSICSILGVGNSLFYRPKEKLIHADNARKNFFRPGGDHVMLLNVYSQWQETGYSTSWCYENFIQYRSMNRARDIREQLEGLLDRVEIEISSRPNDVDAICKSVTSGFFTQAARLNKNGSYRTVRHPHTVEIHPQSSLFGQQAKVVVYTELVLTTKEFMRQVIEIKPEWLMEVAPHYYKDQELQLGAKLPKNTGASASRN